MHKSFKHQFYKDCQLTFALFKDLTNAKELVQSVKNGEFQATLLKPQMVTLFDWNQDDSPTRQLTDTVFETIHRQILRQFTDTSEDNSPTLLFKVNDL